jgi:hypothetical protein
MSSQRICHGRSRARRCTIAHFVSMLATITSGYLIF